jgi:uncharacterized protein YjbI with pentapeptide repeats
VPASERCADCDGVRIQGGHCLAHLTPSEWKGEVARLRRGERLDARRVAISPELLASLLADLAQGGRARLPAVDFGGAQFSGSGDFDGAQFSGDADFREARFSGDADFRGARFSGVARFGGARFSGVAGFRGARFSGVARFGGARFCRYAHFSGAQFSGYAHFGGARFSGDAGFRGARFSGNAEFGEARFSGHADFDRAQFSRYAHFLEAQFSGDADYFAARFSGDAGFRGARFSGNAEFGEARFSGHADFVAAQFSGDANFGHTVVAGTLRCDEAVFDRDLRVYLSASALSCRSTRFSGRAELNVRWAEVALDNAVFVGRSRLVGVGPWPALDESAVRASRADAQYALRADRGDRQLDAQERPRLLSLRQAAVENLALGNVDLRPCRFFGAHGLDELRIEADCEFAAPPGWWRTHRRTLVEEHEWRERRHSRAAISNGGSGPSRPARDAEDSPADAAASGWLPVECQPADWLRQDIGTEVLDPTHIASLYRALRKAFEDRKDEPGAGDFYYGEMEMRRQRPPRTPGPGRLRAQRRFTRDRGERAILTLYWLVSGYGMRGSRALMCLAVTVAAGALLFGHGGFRGTHPAGGPIAFALESTISLLRAPAVKLTAGGEFVQIALRLLGPLFLGLALLALRGRIKR